MIQFCWSTDKKTLWVKIQDPDTSLPPIWFRREASSELECQLLQAHLDRTLGALLEDIRRVSYERGWKDAKKKKAKSTNFPHCLRVLDWER